MSKIKIKPKSKNQKRRRRSPLGKDPLVDLADKRLSSWLTVSIGRKTLKSNPVKTLIFLRDSALE
jgi:hypothetical protein